MPTIHQTPFPEVNRMLGLLQTQLQDALGPTLEGLYLVGSLVTGDFDEAVSDLDLVAVTSDALTPAELDRLAALHHALAQREQRWDNRIEVAYVPVEALATFRDRSSTIAITSPGEPFHTREAGADWLINWYVAREQGIALLGPPPPTFIGPISHDEVIRWVQDHVKLWREWIEAPRSRNGQVYAILMMCRALYTFTTGEFVSKRRSALWAQGQLPAWAAFIEGALRSWREDWYNENVDPRATHADTVRFVHVVVDRIVGDE